MKDFWFASGHHLLDHAPSGGLVVTDDFLKAYLARPELLPPPEACEAERALHAALMADPRRAVPPAEVSAIADEDARENWAFMLRFRDKLLAAPTLEAAYLAIARQKAGDLPPIFLDQLTQLVLRNALDGVEDPQVLRAGELFFRRQKATVHEGRLLLADAETIAMHEEHRNHSPLLAMLGGAAVTELDILDEANAQQYFERADAFDMVLNMGGNPQARRGLAEAIRLFVQHLLGARVSVEALTSVENADFAWFVGLDVEATRIGNALWEGKPLSDDARNRVVCLLRLTFDNPAEALPKVAGRPVYLILAMDCDQHVRMKPQNLVVGLPVASLTGAS